MVHIACLAVNVSSEIAAKILEVIAGTLNDTACLPCQPTCLVSLPALSACLPCQPACLVSLPANLLLALLLKGNICFEQSTSLRYLLKY